MWILVPVTRRCWPTSRKNIHSSQPAPKPHWLLPRPAKQQKLKALSKFSNRRDFRARIAFQRSKFLSQGFITREIGEEPFPAACAGYGLLPHRRYCTGVQILNKVQPAPGQVDILDNYSKNLRAAGTRTASAGGPRTRASQFDFQETAAHHVLPQFAC